jgi:catechol 2,3-dioxygenase-like lactoylglutathione lyase family enzyme
VLNVSDVERSIKFYTEILGFKLSDRNEFGMAFLRNQTDHHTIPSPQRRRAPRSHRPIST